MRLPAMKFLKFLKNRETNKTFLAIAVMAGIAASGYVWWSGRTFTPDAPSPLLVASRSQFASLILDFGDGQKREFRGEVLPPMTVLDALSLSTDAAKLELSYKPEREGVEVTTINGKKASGGKHWAFYVNGKLGEDPAAYEIKPMDVIEWRYE